LNTGTRFLVVRQYDMIHAYFPSRVSKRQMREFNASTTIDASPETVWNILTDAAAYPAWDPTVLRFEGIIAPGEKIRPVVRLSPEQSPPYKVTGFVPGREMTWQAGIRLGLLKIIRIYSLRPLEDGRTELAVQERIGGLLQPIFSRSLPGLRRTYNAFAASLKARAEEP
jgi:hypothetical protein